MDFRILGPLEVHDGDRLLSLGGRQQRALLALLLLHANEVVSVDRIVDELWREAPPPSATKSVQALVSRLRRTLEGEPDVRNSAPGDNGIVRTQAHGYVLTIAPGELDLEQFEALLNAGREALTAGRAHEASMTLRQALALWRGPPLADLAYEPFAQAEVRRLEELRLQTVEERIDADLAAGRHADVVTELEALAVREPLREATAARLMTALYRSGRQAEALEVYRRLRDRLDSDLGLAPGEELRALERAILTQDESLRGPPPPAGPRVRRRRLAAIAAAVAAVAIAAALFARRDPAAVVVPPNSVVAVDPDANRVVAAIPVGVGPVDVAVGGGDVWVANRGDRTVSRIDAATRRLVRNVQLPVAPRALAVTRNDVWVATTYPGMVIRVQVATSAVAREILLPSPHVRGFEALDVAAGGAGVWTATFEGAFRIDTGRSRVARRVAAVGGEQAVLAVDRSAAWIAYQASDAAGTDAFTIARLGRAGHVEASVATEGSVSGIALTSGRVWVALAGGKALHELDRRSLATTSIVALSGDPVALAAGFRSLWVALRNGDVARVDPQSRRVVATFHTAADLTGIAAGAGRVWITVGG